MSVGSNAGPGEGIDEPERVDILTVEESEDSHGSPLGESGLIVVWSGNGYDSKDSWIMCPSEMVCNLGYWQ